MAAQELDARPLAGLPGRDRVEGPIAGAYVPGARPRWRQRGDQVVVGEREHGVERARPAGGPREAAGQARDEPRAAQAVPAVGAGHAAMRSRASPCRRLSAVTTCSWSTSPAPA